MLLHCHCTTFEKLISILFINIYLIKACNNIILISFRFTLIMAGSKVEFKSNNNKTLNVLEVVQQLPDTKHHKQSEGMKMMELHKELVWCKL